MTDRTEADAALEDLLLFIRDSRGFDSPDTSAPRWPGASANG